MSSSAYTFNNPLLSAEKITLILGIPFFIGGIFVKVIFPKFLLSIANGFSP